MRANTFFPDECTSTVSDADLRFLSRCNWKWVVEICRDSQNYAKQAMPSLSSWVDSGLESIGALKSDDLAFWVATPELANGGLRITMLLAASETTDEDVCDAFQLQTHDAVTVHAYEDARTVWTWLRSNRFDIQAAGGNALHAEA